MFLTLLNDKYERLAIIDEYESLLWIERFSGYGDFELEVPINTTLKENVKLDYYLTKNDTDVVMIIDTIEEINQDESSDILRITGKSLESILDRRVELTSDYMTGSINQIVMQLINNNIINPFDQGRVISNYKYISSTDEFMDKTILSISAKGQSIYSIINSLCSSYNVGIKTILDDDNNFVTYLYRGKDRSYDQTDNSYVIFSKEFDNIFNSTKIKSNVGVNTVAVVSDSAEGNKKTTLVVPSSYGEGVGLKRREISVESSNTGKDDETTVEEYERIIYEEGVYSLNTNESEEFTIGEVDTEVNFIYGKDYFIGDTVQNINVSGETTKSLVSEITVSNDINGYRITPIMSSLGENTTVKKIYDDWVYELGTPLLSVNIKTEDLDPAVASPYLFLCEDINMGNSILELVYKPNKWGRFMAMTDLTDTYNFWIYTYPSAKESYMSSKKTPTDESTTKIGTYDNFWSLNKKTILWNGEYILVNDKPSLNADVIKSKTIKQLSICSFTGGHDSTEFSDIDFYGFKWFQDGIKKIHVIPFKNLNNEVGFLDLVSKEFSKGVGIKKITESISIDSKIEILPYAYIESKSEVAALPIDVILTASIKANERTGKIKIQHEFTPVVSEFTLTCNRASDVASSSVLPYKIRIRPFMQYYLGNNTKIIPYPVLINKKNLMSMEYEYGVEEYTVMLNNNIINENVTNLSVIDVQNGVCIFTWFNKLNNAYDRTFNDGYYIGKFHNYKIYIDDILIADIYPISIDSKDVTFYDTIQGRILNIVNDSVKILSSKEYESMTVKYLEWIKLDGLYLETGVENDSEDMMFEFEGIFDVNVSTGSTCIFGSREYSSSLSIFSVFAFVNTSRNLSIYMGNKYYTLGTVPNIGSTFDGYIKITVTIKGLSLRFQLETNEESSWSGFDSTFTRTIGEKYMSTYPVILGGEYRLPNLIESITPFEEGAIHYPFNGKITRFAITKNGVKQIDLKACEFDDSVGMWDEVTNSFHRTVGVGTVTAGPEKEVG